MRDGDTRHPTPVDGGDAVTSFTDCVRTEAWSGLEPDVLENKWYCPDVGVVREETVRGGTEVVELTDYQSGG